MTWLSPLMQPCCDALMGHWDYGLKTVTKDESNTAIWKWVSDIMEIRNWHPFQIVISDNTSKLKDNGLIDL
jgi:hypothetical protein